MVETCLFDSYISQGFCHEGCTNFCFVPLAAGFTLEAEHSRVRLSRGLQRLHYDNSLSADTHTYLGEARNLNIHFSEVRVLKLILASGDLTILINECVCLIPEGSRPSEELECTGFRDYSVIWNHMLMKQRYFTTGRVLLVAEEPVRSLYGKDPIVEIHYDCRRCKANAKLAQMNRAKYNLLVSKSKPVQRWSRQSL